MEIMANSDNVLRGGLTVKHIDVQELLKHIKFEPIIPNILNGIKTTTTSSQVLFPTPADDFELYYLPLTAGESVEIKSHTAEVFFIYQGAVEVNKDLVFKRGEAMLAIAGASFPIKGLEKSIVFRATVPIK